MEDIKGVSKLPLPAFSLSGLLETMNQQCKLLNEWDTDMLLESGAVSYWKWRSLKLMSWNWKTDYLRMAPLGHVLTAVKLLVTYDDPVNQ